MDQVLDFALMKTKVKDAISVAEVVPTSASRSKD
jgi:hypothetical protein